MSSDNPSWHRACEAAKLLAANSRLGGIIVRARSGVVRNKFLEMLPTPSGRIHPGIGEEALTGGIDIAATLVTGAIVRTAGLIQPNACLVVAMAERLPRQIAGRLAQAMDTVPGFRLILLDEGASDDERVSDTLIDRLPFFVDLNDVPQGAATQPKMPKRKKPVVPTETDIMVIAEVSETLGIASARAPLFALDAACTSAALANSGATSPADIELACALTLAHRATRVPDEPQSTDEPTPPPPETGDNANNGDDAEGLPDELLIEAVLSALPPEVLGKLAAKASKGGQGAGSGAKRRGNRRGRPLPSRQGHKTDDKRLDLYATLRAAAPWQTLRKLETKRAGLQLRSRDLHVKRYEETSDRLIIFAVDASGSSAISRLAEAKGAVELLLSEAYARRDHVALLAFRGKAAEVLLPPTRSLVQTKRRLADLPGGGGTPLASGLEAALDLALNAQRRGMMPQICILTDGRANIDLAGNLDRPAAMSDAETMAGHIVRQGIDALVIDTGVRPERKLRALAETLHAPYVPMPRANAERLSRAIAAAVD